MLVRFFFHTYCRIGVFFFPFPSFYFAERIKTWRSGARWVRNPIPFIDKMSENVDIKTRRWFFIQWRSNSRRRKRRGKTARIRDVILVDLFSCLQLGCRPYGRQVCMPFRRLRVPLLTLIASGLSSEVRLGWRLSAAFGTVGSKSWLRGLCKIYLSLYMGVLIWTLLSTR